MIRSSNDLGGDRLARLHAIDLAELRGPAEHAVEPDLEHAHAARGLRPAQAPLGRDERLGLPVLLGTVAQHFDEADLLLVLVAERRQLAAGPESAAVAAHMPALVDRAALLERGGHLSLRRARRLVLNGEDAGRMDADHLRLGPPEHRLRAPAPFGDDAVGVGHDDREVAGAIDDRAVAAAVGLGLRRRPAQLERRHHLAGERPERLLLRRVERAGLMVEHADGADRQPLGRFQQRARIETQVRLARDERIAGKAPVLRRVGHLEILLLQQRLGAEGSLDRRLAYAQADLGLKELAAVADEVHDRDRHLADRGGEFGDLVERALARGVEHVVPRQRGQPQRLQDGRVIGFAVHRSGLGRSAPYYQRHRRRCRDKPWRARLDSNQRPQA